MNARNEYELKARLDEAPEALFSRLEEGGWSLRFTGRMVDLRLDTPDGRLASDDEVLRLRVYLPEEAGEPLAVLGWKGPAATEQGFKRREEVETRVASARAAREIAARLGFDRILERIDRRIRLFVRENVSIRVEEYPRMDVLVELEGPPGEVRKCIPELGIPADEWKPWPLPEFVARYEERTGREARLHDGGALPGEEDE